MVNAGFVGRDQKAVKAHIEELAREGIAPPPTVPMLFPVLRQSLTLENKIEVVERQTSGEVEFVLLLQGGRMYVGIGSDHTDRKLEAASMLNSKQVCPNVMSREVWDFEDVKDHWDELVMESRVRPSPGAESVLYQQGPLGKILSATDLLALVKSRMPDGQCEGLMIFSGTLPVLTKEMIWATQFRCELGDPRLQRQLTCEYEIVRLDYLTEA
jgi:hypothetical protein